MKTYVDYLGRYCTGISLDLTWERAKWERCNESM